MSDRHCSVTPRCPCVEPVYVQRDALADLLRRLVGEYDERRATLYNGPMSYLTSMVAAARPLLAEIDGAPAKPATESIELREGFCSEHDGMHEQFSECENWRAGRMSVFVNPAPAEREA